MAWVITATLGSAAIGALGANEQRKAQAAANQQNANIAAAQSEFSPWTGIKPQTAQMEGMGPSALQGGLSGALGGAMFAKKMGLGDKPAAKEAPPDKPQSKNSIPPAPGPVATPMAPPAGSYTPISDDLDGELNNYTDFVRKNTLPPR